MTSVDSILQSFVSNLKREGMEVPTEIFFPKKTYDRLALEAMHSVHYDEYWTGKTELTLYVQDKKIVIRKHVCKECGQ